MTDNKYKNGKIYTIRYTNDDTLTYVGSTTQPLYKMFMDHKKTKLLHTRAMPLLPPLNALNINKRKNR